MPHSSGALDDLTRSIQKPHRFLIPAPLTPWQSHRQLMGPNSFSLFCVLETVFALLAVIALFQAAPQITDQGPTTGTWYTVLTISTVVIHAAFLMYRGIRREFSPATVWPALPIAYLAYFLWPLASSSPTVCLPWSWLLGLYGLLAPLCLSRVQVTIAHMVGLSLSLGISETLTALINHTPTSYKDIFSDVFFFAALASILGGMVSLAMRSAGNADTVYTDSMSAHLRFNRNRDQAKELQDFDKLVHDNVMAALLDASRIEGNIADRTRTLARRALTVLDEETFRQMPHRPVTFQALTEQIAKGISPWNSRLRFVSDEVENFPRADPESPMPQEAARAFAHAVTEAVSNSARHSDSRVTSISIRTEMRPPLRARRRGEDRPYIICTIADRGRGFNVNSLDTRRMGVRVSMVRSMEEVGGLIDIKSAPEKGTTVVIQWPDEEVDAG